MSRLTSTQLANLKMAAEAAVDVEMKTGIPAVIPTCQFCLESGWGEYVFVNNPFGIKATTSDKLSGTRVLKLTREVFNAKELAWFKSLGDSRVVVGPYIDKKTGKQQVQGDRLGWLVRDWFKSFRDLEEAFTFHSRFFTDPTMIGFKAFQQYKKDKQLQPLINSLSRYAMDANYVKDITTFSKYTEIQAAIAAARIEYGRKDTD
jgi:hypothetical protein